MKKRIIPVLLVMLVLSILLLVGVVLAVWKSTPAQPEPVAQAQAPHSDEPPLTLPDQYRLVPLDDGWQILEKEAAVGWLLVTELDPLSLLDSTIFQGNGTDALHAWLDRFIEPPQEKEYMMGSSTGNILLEVELGSWNPQTQTSSWSHHYFFVQEDICYDLVLLDAMAGPAARSDIRSISGMDPDCRFLAADLSKLPQWPEIAECPQDQLMFYLNGQAQRCDIEAFWGEPTDAAPDFSTMTYTAPTGTTVTLTFTSDGVVSSVTKG